MACAKSIRKNVIKDDRPIFLKKSVDLGPIIDKYYAMEQKKKKRHKT